MARTNDLMATTEDREIVISRLVNAPRELVFEAWTDPKHLIQWWGPKGFTNTFQSIAVKPGGVWKFIMHGPDGVDYPNLITFHEVVKPELITFSHGTGEENDPHQFETRVTFEKKGDKTLLTMKSIFSSADERDKMVREVGAIEGGNQTLDRLEEQVLKITGINKTPFTIERIYKAPIARVWKAITDKNQMKQWYFDLEEFKPEVGFEFQFSGGPPQKSYLHLCRVVEVVPERKIAYTWRYDGYEGNSTVIWELFEEGDMTRLKLTHEGLESFLNEPDFAKKNFVAGWTDITGLSLKDYLEGKA
jgi:uncharacterized protein YndB with AHSA1/START domain